MDGGAWWAAAHGVAKSWTRLSDFALTFHFHALEKEMATHSSVLAWRIPGTGEPGGLPSMGSHRVSSSSVYVNFSLPIFPPTPAPGNHKFVWYICDSLLFCKYIHLYQCFSFFKASALNDIIWYLSVFV